MALQHQKPVESTPEQKPKRKNGGNGGKKKRHLYPKSVQLEESYMPPVQEEPVQPEMSYMPPVQEPAQSKRTTNYYRIRTS